MQRFDRLLGRGVLDESTYEELEQGLLESDASVDVTMDILKSLRSAVRSEGLNTPEEARERLKTLIAARFLDQPQEPLRQSATPPTVYMFVGVNGVGKTTSIAKLAQRLNSHGRSVVLAAGDTFRAAAIEQLEVWAGRVGAGLVRSQPGGDAGAVAFDAISSARARGADYVLIDTAGRQHTKENLMSEISKVARVAERALDRPPDEVLLVLDANTGQNALRQAEEFIKAAGVTGIILTKLDGTARGGALIGLYERFKVPIKLIGVGEGAGDLRDFDPARFASELFD